jgi:uncharacterized protein YidB (DUF937 family)
MKKLIISIVIVALVAVTLVGAAFAQSNNPPAQPNSGYGYGMGRMGGRGAGMGRAGSGLAGTQSGYLHDEMVAAFAEKLGLTVDELNSRLAKGETLSQIASSKGLTYDEFRTLWSEARSEALDQAVSEGKLTQEQADWMKSRGGGMMGGYGRGGQGTNPNCPYYSQSNP